MFICNNEFILSRNTFPLIRNKYNKYKFHLLTCTYIFENPSLKHILTTTGPVGVIDFDLEKNSHGQTDRSAVGSPPEILKDDS